MKFLKFSSSKSFLNNFFCESTKKNLFTLNFRLYSSFNKKEEDSKKKQKQYKSIKRPNTNKIITNRNINDNLVFKIFKVEQVILENNKKNNLDSKSKIEVIIKNKKKESFFFHFNNLRKSRVLNFFFLYLPKKVFQLSLLALLIYLFYQTNFLSQLVNKFVGDAFIELKKLIMQLYIGDTSLFIDDVLCDIFEDQKFIEGIDNLLIRIYNDPFLKTNVKNLFWEAFSIFLKDMHHGSLLHTLLVNILDDTLFTKVSNKFFFEFFKKIELQGFVEDYLLELFEEKFFRAYLNYIMKSTLLYYVHKSDFKENFRDFIKGFIVKDIIYERVLTYYYMNFNMNHENDYEMDREELEYLFGIKLPYDHQEYIKCVKLDMNNNLLKQKFLTGKTTAIDLFTDNQYDYDPPTLNEEVDDKEEFIPNNSRDELSYKF